MGFIQIVEIKTSRIAEVKALVDEFLEATEGKRTALRATLTADRDSPDTYLQIVEFDSYEDAMANSELAETTALAGKLAELCDEPPAFRNLDVEQVEDLA